MGGVAGRVKKEKEKETELIINSVILDLSRHRCIFLKLLPNSEIHHLRQTQNVQGNKLYASHWRMLLLVPEPVTREVLFYPRPNIQLFE